MQKNGAEIAKEIGISRQAVSQTITKALRKVYVETRKQDENKSPFEIVLNMMKILEIEESDLHNFIQLLPDSLLRSVKSDALKKFPFITNRTKVFR